MKYKVIVRDPEEGTEHYIEGLTKASAIQKAAMEAADTKRKVYIEWTKSNGESGYLNRDGGTECPGEPW